MLRVIKLIKKIPEVFYCIKWKNSFLNNKEQKVNDNCGENIPVG